MKALLLSLVVFGAIAAGVGAIRARPASPVVSIRTDTGAVAVRVELATTPEAWSRGLMGRRSLAENAGMLFVFPDETVRVFWMKDTLIALDVIFADASGTIVSVTTMAPCADEPASGLARRPEAACPTYESGAPARYALEVRAGFAKRHGIKAGQIIVLPATGQR